MKSQGTGNRYANDYGGNHIQRIRDTAPSLGQFVSYNKRFCETCQRKMPSDRTKAVKGWKCAECRGKK